MSQSGLGAAAVHRRLVEARQSGRTDEALVLIDPDIVDHRGGLIGDVHGRDAWRRKWAEMDNSASSSMTVTIDQNVEAGEISVNRYTIRGGQPGRTFETTGMDMVLVREGRVVEHWAYMDLQAMQRPR